MAGLGIMMKKHFLKFREVKNCLNQDYSSGVGKVPSNLTLILKVNTEIFNGYQRETKNDI